MARTIPGKRAARASTRPAAGGNANKTPRTVIGQRRRLRILDIAEREFTARGYVDASVNTIIRKAGGSKSSISQYFHNKVGLFAAVIENRASALVHMLEEHSLEGTPREILQRLGEDFLAYTMRPGPLMGKRGMIAVGYRHRELPEVFFGIGHSPILSYVTRLFEHWRAQGIIAPVDTAWSAATFLHLLAGGLHEQVLTGMKAGYTDAEVRDEVRRIVDFFWRSVRARPDAG